MIDEINNSRRCISPSIGSVLPVGITAALRGEQEKRAAADGSLLKLPENDQGAKGRKAPRD
jgi:hypothetical protein